MSNNYTSANGANLYTDDSGFILTDANRTAFIPKPEDVPALALDVLRMVGIDPSDVVNQSTHDNTLKMWAAKAQLEDAATSLHNHLLAVRILAERAEEVAAAKAAAEAKAEWLAFRTSPEALAGLALFNEMVKYPMSEWLPEHTNEHVALWIDKAKEAVAKAEVAIQAERDAVAEEFFKTESYSYLVPNAQSSVDTIIDLRRQLASM